MSDTAPRIYETEIQCDNCYERFGVQFSDPGESFEATCPYCDAYYPELYV